MCHVHAYRHILSPSETNPAIAIPFNSIERRKRALIESPDRGKTLKRAQPIALYPLRHGIGGKAVRDQLYFAPPDDTSTPSGPGAVVLCAFGHNHWKMLELAQHFIMENRDDMGLERPWSINVVITCPDMMPNLEGSLMYDEAKWYAEITLRCDLSQNVDLLIWVLVHECLELKDWRTGSVFQDLSQFLQQEYDGGEIGEKTLQIVERQYLQKYLRARNQEIEQRVHEYLGIYRPAHLPAGKPPRSPLSTTPLGESGGDPDPGNQDDNEKESG